MHTDTPLTTSGFSIRAALPSLDAHLTAIEQAEDTTILGGWVAGSHARNVANTESDIDVNFVFLQPLTSHACLTTGRETIRTTNRQLSDHLSEEHQFETEVEFQGWDTTRFLQLLAGREDGNNPSAIETLVSPLPIRTHPEFKEMATHVSTRFNVIELHNHFKSLAKSNWRECQETESEPTVKQLLFILQSIFFARHIRDTHSFPTLNLVQFTEEAPDSVFDGVGRDSMRRLIAKKQAGDGGERVSPTPFRDFIESFLNTDLQHRDHIREEQIDATELDELMASIIRRETQ